MTQSLATCAIAKWQRQSSLTKVVIYLSIDSTIKSPSPSTLRPPTLQPVPPRTFRPLRACHSPPSFRDVLQLKEQTLSFTLRGIVRCDQERKKQVMTSGFLCNTDFASPFWGNGSNVSGLWWHQLRFQRCFIRMVSKAQLCWTEADFCLVYPQLSDWTCYKFLIYDVLISA